jgi:hypothetical protein
MLGPRRESWVFVGESGTTYEAESPLGPFVSSSSPPSRLARVSSGDHNLLGISETGRLLASEDAGASWHATGPATERFSDVMLWPPHGLALAVPERLWWSDNEGRSWAALDAPAFGAERFDRDDEAGPVLRAALGARRVRFEPGASAPQLLPLGRVVRSDEPSLSAAPQEGPSARAISSGRAFSSDGFYFEVELGVRAESLSGRFTGSLTRRNQPALSACVEIEVAGFRNWVYAACTRERTGTARGFEFFRSVDAGETFEREPYTARGNPELVQLAVGEDGALLATGFCPAQDELAGCHARGIQARREGAGDAGASPALEPMAAPALDDTALALTFSADGRSAFAVGQRTKSDALFIFVANDLAHGFSAREIARLEASGSPSQRQVKSLTAARDGQLSLVTSQSSGPDQLVILDANGRTASVNSAPLDVAAMGAYGSQALAVGPEEVWESLDGGAHWDDIGRLPRSTCAPSRTRCNIPISCQQEGCSVGDSLTRLGWRADPNGSALAVLPPSAPRDRATRRALAKAFACELADSEWTELAGVERLPDASQAALGKAAWFALSTDDATAAAGLWIADAAREGAPRVRYSELLRPSERAAESAYFAQLQVEGAAALRYPVPGSAGAPGTHLTRVEIAWENLFEGRRGRASIVDAGAQLPGDYTKSAGPARQARADLLSIASGGIYTRLHHQPEHDQITYFLDGSSVEEVAPLSSELLALKGTTSEMVRVGQENLALLFVGPGTTLIRAKRQREHWVFDAMSYGFADPERFPLRQNREVTYAQGRATLHATTRFADGSSDSRLFPLQAEGPVFGAATVSPTQARLPEGSLGCAQRERQSTPRLLAPQQPGTRHPILVHDPVEPLRVFLSDTAVMYGGPDSACAVAFDAEPVRTPQSVPGARERVLLSADGPSWLFRVAPDNARRDTRIEYRSMRCNIDAGAEVPAEVYELPGTHSEG